MDKLGALSHALLAVATFGLLVQLVELGLLRWHLRRPTPRARTPRSFSILKPLCGVDDDLTANLEVFATLDHPDFELLLGVRNTADPAYEVARATERRFPGRVRVVLQRGEPGLNPKVNQLITLAAVARNEIFVVSDSNVRVHPSYLSEIEGYLDDPEVGLVTHPVAGTGARRLGSLLDNLHMSCAIGPGMVAIERLFGKPMVVGKSMAVRREDLARLGGFGSMRDVLAEDYEMGSRVRPLLGKRVVVAHRVIENVSQERSVTDFYDRYCRWGVIHRKTAGFALYSLETLASPLLFAAAAWLVAPSKRAAAAVAGVAVVRTIIDGLLGAVIRPVSFRTVELLAVPVKDAMIIATWIHGLCRSTILWRSNRLVVLEGGHLSRPAGLVVGGLAEVHGGTEAELLDNAV